MSVLGILEDALQTHPAVGEAAVVASPDELLGGVPKAFIAPRHAPSPRELIAWVADQATGCLWACESRPCISDSTFRAHPASALTRSERALGIE